MTDPRASEYIVQDVSDTTEGPGYRWAYERPVLRFYRPSAKEVKFSMDFAIPERLLRATGPITLTFKLNGKLLDRVRYAQAGQLQFTHDVPTGALKDGINTVAIEPDRVWTTGDGTKLSFVLARAGFLE
jgi:hypothetical protein